MYYWRRDNGDYILFRSKGAQYVAEYGAYDFVLTENKELGGWILRYYHRTGPTSGTGGQVAFFDGDLPPNELLEREVESFLKVMDRVP